MTLGGQLTELSTAASGTPSWLVLGSDGNLWFTEGSRVGYFSPP